MTAMKEHLKTRMKDGEEAEEAGKAKADEEAADFLKVPPNSHHWRPTVSQDRGLSRPQEFPDCVRCRPVTRCCHAFHEESPCSVQSSTTSLYCVWIGAEPLWTGTLFVALAGRHSGPGAPMPLHSAANTSPDKDMSNLKTRLVARSHPCLCSSHLFCNTLSSTMLWSYRDGFVQ